MDVPFIRVGVSNGSSAVVVLDDAGTELYSRGGMTLASNAGSTATMILSNGVLRVDGISRLGDNGQARVVFAGGSMLVTNKGIATSVRVPDANGTGVLVMASADSLLEIDTNSLLVANGTNGYGELILSNGAVSAGTIEIGNGRASSAAMYMYNATCTLTRLAGSGLNIGSASFSTGLLVVADSRAMIVATNGTGITLGGQTFNVTTNSTGRLLLSNGTIIARGFRVGYNKNTYGEAIIGHGTLINRQDIGIIIGQNESASGRLVMAESDSLINATNTAAGSPMIVGSGINAVGTLIMSNGTMLLSRLVIGNNTGSYGLVTMENQSQIIVRDNIYMPNNASGAGNATGILVLASQDAKLIVTNNNIVLGSNQSGSRSAEGHLIISNGMVFTRLLYVGQASDGKLTILNGSVEQGSTANGEGLRIGNSSEGGTGLVVLAHANAAINLPRNTLVLATAQNAAGRLIISNGTVLVRDVQLGGTAATHTNSHSEILIGDGSLSTTSGAFQCGVGERTTTRVVLQHPNARLIHPNGVINLGMATNSSGLLILSNGTLHARGVNLGGNTAGGAPYGQYGEWITYNATNILRNQGAGTAVWVAGQPLSTGLMVLAHANAVVDSTNDVLVGDFGNGTLLVSNGYLSGRSLHVGNATGSLGRLEVSAGTLNLVGDLTAGKGGAGSILISGGSVTASNLILIALTTSTNATATVELAGGTCSVRRISAFAAPGASSNLLLSGGTLAAVVNLTNSLVTTLTTSPGPGTVTLDTAANAVVQAGLLTGAGGLAKAGTGELRLMQDNDFTGQTLVNEGTLALVTGGSLDGSTSIVVAAGALLSAAARTDGTLTVGAGQRLSGNGSVLGTVVNNGTVAPGSSPGSLLLVGDYSQSGTLAIELSGLTPVTEHDVLAVTNHVTLGGTLTVTTPSFTPASGNSFTVLTAAAVSGTFATTNLPALGGGLVWVVTYEADKVVLSITGGGVDPTAYEVWAASFNLTGADAYNQADPDGDGYLNLLEYALGSNPTSDTSNVKIRLVQTNGTNRLLLQRVNTATDVVYEVEGSYSAANNAAWSVIASNVLGTWGGATVDDNNTGAVHEVRVTDAATATNRFLRLRVTRP